MKRFALLLALALALPSAAQVVKVPPVSTVAGLPAASSALKGRIRSVTDGASLTDCVTGGGAYVVSCVDIGSAWQWIGYGGAGSATVTSVALTMPGEFSVAGSPITTYGTLAVTKATQLANSVYAGPSSGASAAPSFRALVAGDIPALPYLADSTTYAGSASQGGAATTATALAADPAACPSSRFVTDLSAAGTLTCAQPACSDLSNASASCSTDATNAANLASGTVPTARLGSGTADNTTYLRGDNTWATVSTGVPDPLSVGTVQGPGASGTNLLLRSNASSTTGLLQLFCTTSSCPALSMVTGGFRIVNGNFSGAMDVYADGLKSPNETTPLLSGENGHWQIYQGGTISWYSGASTCCGTGSVDTVLSRSAAGVISADTDQSHNGLATLRATALLLIPGAVGSCGAGQKGLQRVAADGSLCSCNGSVWTATPLTGSCT